MAATSQLSADAACFVPSGLLFTQRYNNHESRALDNSKMDGMNRQLYQPVNASTTHPSSHGRGRGRGRARLAQQPEMHSAVSPWPDTSYSFPNQPVHLGSVAVPVFSSTFSVPAVRHQSVNDSARHQLRSNLSEQFVANADNLDSFGNQLVSSIVGVSATDDTNRVTETESKTKKKRKRKTIVRELNGDSQKDNAMMLLRTVYKDGTCQTDFPVELARKSLSDAPNSLYSKKREVGAVEKGSRMPSASFTVFNDRSNRQNQSSSSGSIVDQLTFCEKKSSDRLHPEMMLCADSIDQSVREAEVDPGSRKTSVPPPVRLWSCLISPGDKFTSVKREKNVASVPSSAKSSSRDEKLRSVTPSRDKVKSESNLVESRSCSDVRQTDFEPRLLTPSRDRANKTNSGHAAGPKSNLDKNPVKSKIYADGDNRKLPQNARDLSAGKKGSGEKKPITDRQSRATSQGRPDQVSLETKDTKVMEQSPNLALGQISASQSGVGKLKRGKKKSATSSDIVIVPDSVVPLHQIIAPHLNDFGEFPSLPVTESRVDKNWDVSHRRRSGSSVSQVSALSDECNIVDQADHQMSSVRSTAADSRELKQKQTSEVRQPRHQTMPGKKSDQPIMFSLFDVLVKNASKQDKDKKSKKASKNTKTIGEKSTRVLNKVSASAPVKRRGKEREGPKVRKPTNTRKIILSERESRRQKFLQDMVLGNFNSSLSRYMPPTWLVSATDGLANEACSDNRLNEAEAEKKALLLSKIHSRRFREYCSQMLTPEINGCCIQLLQELVRFQDRLFHKDPVKAKMKRRLVLGLREVTKHLKLRKIKCIIISPNLERVQSKGGLDESLYGIIKECQQQGVLVIFALSRKALGKACAKHVPVSIVGIFSYEGAEEHYNVLRQLADRARQDYADIVAKTERELANVEDVRDDVVDSDTGLDAPSTDVFTDPEGLRLRRLRLSSPASSVRSTADSEPTACCADEDWYSSDVEASGSRAYHSEGELSVRRLSDDRDDEGDEDFDHENHPCSDEGGRRHRSVSPKRLDAETRMIGDQEPLRDGCTNSSADYISRLLSSNFRRFGQAKSTSSRLSAAESRKSGDVDGDERIYYSLLKKP